MTWAILHAHRPFTVLRPSELDVVENNDFCLAALSANLADTDSPFAVFSSTAAIPSDLQYDMVVIDGGGDLPNDMGPQSVADRVAVGGVILVEGGRRGQREAIRDLYGHRRHLSVKSVPRAPLLRAPSGEAVRNKSCHLYFFEPGARATAIALGLRAGTAAARLVRAVGSRLSSHRL